MEQSLLDKYSAIFRKMLNNCFVEPCSFIWVPICPICAHAIGLRNIVHGYCMAEFGREMHELSALNFILCLGIKFHPHESINVNLMWALLIRDSMVDGIYPEVQEMCRKIVGRKRFACFCGTTVKPRHLPHTYTIALHSTSDKELRRWPSFLAGHLVVSRCLCFRERYATSSFIEQRQLPTRLDMAHCGSFFVEMPEFLLPRSFYPFLAMS